MIMETHGNSWVALGKFKRESRLDIFFLPEFSSMFNMWMKRATQPSDISRVFENTKGDVWNAVYKPCNPTESGWVSKHAQNFLKSLLKYGPGVSWVL